MAWHGMAWHGMAWHGMAWHGMAWHGLAWHGLAFLAWLGLAWPGLACQKVCTRSAACQLHARHATRVVSVASRFRSCEGIYMHMYVYTLAYEYVSMHMSVCIYTRKHRGSDLAKERTERHALLSFGRPKLA